MKKEKIIHNLSGAKIIITYEEGKQIVCFCAPKKEVTGRYFLKKDIEIVFDEMLENDVVVIRKENLHREVIEALKESIQKTSFLEKYVLVKDSEEKVYKRK